MTDSKVWVSTAAISAVLYPKEAHKPRADSDTVNWGWTAAAVLEGGRSGDDGALDGSSGIKVQVEDVESEFNRQIVEVSGKAIKEGAVVMMNYHGDEDDDDGYGSDASGGRKVNFDGEEACGYPDDLITLTHLHEPAVVHCLRKRYEQDKIYTNTGPILIALNPFKSCKSLYSDRVMKQYYERGEARSLMGGGSSGGGGDNGEEGDSGEDALSPHVYDLADATYRSMLTKIDIEGSNKKSGSSQCDQSILVSGESGAGKTVTTKFIMQYLATLSERRAEAKANGGRAAPKAAPKKGKKGRGSSMRTSLTKQDSSGNVNIEQQVLQSNPILESFGNARTHRNDNSSRFGKFIELRFTPLGTLVGASIETYLLEKVRLISQAEGERNYHVFYEILAGMTDNDLDSFLLSEYSAEDFKITSCSGTYDRRDGVKDTDTYEDLVDALEVMGFSPETQNDVFGVVAAVLHMSNLTINPTKGGEECEIDGDNEHLDPILELMGITKEDLNQAICYFKIEARGQSYTRAVQKETAEKGLEALIKATYSALFDFNVKTINASISVKKKTGKPDGGDDDGGKKKRSKDSDGGNAVIGVLDIFGFESFKTNSFEQLCINYCNEALQQQFNLFVLKNEQEEYEQEGIKWSFISFPDNQDALDLIWKKGYGILNILDDQCRAPGTTDKTFANDLYQKLTNKPRFEANFRQVGARQFGVFHYAGLVEYDTNGFVEKNKDELPRETTDLLLSSTSAFIRGLAAIISKSSAPEPAKPSRGKKKKVTVGGHFASQLTSLRQKIDLTSPHYVRCLKPNGQLVPDNFDPLMIVEQLRCAGVVEAVRVSRVGYPQRYNHSQFVSRYRTLGVKEMKKASKSSRKVKPVVALVDAIAKKMWAIENKVVWTPPKKASKKDKKSSSSEEKVDLLAIGIQVGKTKVFLRRRAFDILEKMRKDFMAAASIKVQAIARGYIHRRNFNEYCKANIQLQCWVRVILAERKVQAAREQFNAQRIQSTYRQHRGRRTYLAVFAVARWCQRRQRGATGRAHYKKVYQIRCAAIVIQCAVRIRQSSMVLAKLQQEAKDLSNVVEERDKFRERMEQMRIEMERVKEEAKKEAEEAARLEKEANARDTSMSADLEDELTRVKEELANTQKELEKERQRSLQATDLAEERGEELEIARDSISQLESKLEEAIAKDSDDESSTMNEKEMMLQNKLDEQISLSRQREREIKKLTSELSQRSDNDVPTQPQSADLGVSSIEYDDLKTELESTKKQLITAQQLLSTGDLSQQEEMQQEIEALRKEVKRAKVDAASNKDNAAADSPSEYTSFASEMELDKLREENQRLKIELKHGRSGPSPPPPDSLSVSTSTSKSEKKLKKEIAKLKDANKKILDTAEQQFSSLSGLEKENAELKTVIESLRNGNTGGVDGSFRDSLEKAQSRMLAEKARAEEAVAREAKLRTEIAQMRLNQQQSNGDCSHASVVHKATSDDEAPNEIATLQFEIERLSNELIVAKEEARTTDTFSADDMIRKYDELKRLAESGMQKDLEIEKLKLRVNTQEAELKGLREEVTEDDLTFGVREYQDGEEAIAAAQNEGLRSLNEELSKQLELYKKESDQAKIKLAEERRRSEMEMKAFSVALRGVDDLRIAAENMSRELHYIKKHGYVPPGGMSGTDTSGAVRDAMSAVESMAKASQSIDHPALNDEANAISQRERRQDGFSLWNAMNAVMTPGQVDAMQTVTETTGGLFNDTNGVKKKSSSKHKGRRRKKKGDGGSIISSFF